MIQALDRACLHAWDGGMDINAAVITEAINWATDCMGRITRVSADRAIRYVMCEYEGGWDAFVQDMENPWR